MPRSHLVSTDRGLYLSPDLLRGTINHCLSDLCELCARFSLKVRDSSVSSSFQWTAESTESASIDRHLSRWVQIYIILHPHHRRHWCYWYSCPWHSADEWRLVSTNVSIDTSGRDHVTCVLRSNCCADLSWCFTMFWQLIFILYAVDLLSLIESRRWLWKRRFK